MVVGMRQWGPVRLGRILEQTIARRLTGSQWLPGPRVVSLVGVVSCNRAVSLLLSLFLSLSLSPLSPFPSVFLSMPALSFFLLTCTPPVPPFCRVPFLPFPWSLPFFGRLVRASATINIPFARPCRYLLSYGSSPRRDLQ